MNLFRALYYAPMSSVKVDGVRHEMFAIESGFAQGCPASGSVWAFAMDPIIRHFALTIDRVDPGCDPHSNYLGA
eukprot:1422472-Pyramimonas_sp.AAC.1